MSSGPSQVAVEGRGAVAVVRFVNPPAGFIANKGAAQLRDALSGLLADPAVRVVILTGAQAGVFIRHADVSQIARAGDAVAEGRIGPGSFVTTPFCELATLLRDSLKPIIAAIDGDCMGGGFELALNCTMRIAGAPVAAIGLPEVKVDIFPGLGGIERMARLVGMHRARLFALRGEVVSAAEALVLGLVDEVAPDALARALQVAEELAGRNPATVATIMRLARDNAALEETGIAMAELLGAEAGIRTLLHAFVESGERLQDLP